MSEDVATGHDLSRQDATGDDLISIKEAHQIFTSHGRAITERTLQRYCEKKQLMGQKRITSEGEKWFVLKSSALTRIKELAEFDSLRASRQAATIHDVSASVVEENQNTFHHDSTRQATEQNVSSPVEPAPQSRSTSNDMSRQDATGNDMSGQNETVEQQTLIALSDRERELYEQIVATYKDQIEELRSDKKLLQDDKKMLMEQLISKDRQIEHFFSSERDTKKLFGSLQNIMTYLWPGSKRKDPTEELPEAYGPVVRDVGNGLDDEHRQSS